MEVGVGVWLRDSQGGQAWVPALIDSKEYRDNKIFFTVVTEDGGDKQVFSLQDENQELDDVKLRNDSNDTKVDNLINLPYLHEPAILYCLEERYSKSDIYTFTGPILIAVNPFKSVPLYGAQILENYYNHGLMKSQGLMVANTLPPHVYSIADAAYRDMMSVILQGSSAAKKGSIANQSILISGESGAGKTESTKIVLKYLTTLGSTMETATTKPSTNKSKDAVMDKILQSNPILEAFGNARTIRNDNSSRFGKFIELNFSKRGILIGGLIRTYLLEKVRLPSQQVGERNFHIFYQLFAGASNQDKTSWGLNKIEDYWYTSQGKIFTLKHVDDKEEFTHLKTAFQTLNFSEADQIALLNAMAGLLHLGQLKFQPDNSGDGCILDTTTDPNIQLSLNKCTQLLGISNEDLLKVLTTRILSTRNESYEIKLKANQAVDARDALAKAIYGQLFDWIVRTINLSIQVDPTLIRAEIGVLDIFGFECFKHNSFEQLCINYTNETLQQQFNQFVFKMEQIEYQKERIEWSFIEFPDNQDCLDLIEHKTKGLFAMLDDECKLPGASDEKYANRLYKAYDNNARFQVTNVYKRDFKFCIVHYAGPVVYATATFVEKNKDELPKEADMLFRSSTVNLISNVFVYKSMAALGELSDTNNPANHDSVGRRGSSKGKAQSSTQYSVSTQFKEQLSLLMEKIYSTSPHYIRCLKPNDENVPDSLNRKRTTEQLRYGGVLEAVRVARSGFPIRLSHTDFFARYRCLANPFNDITVILPSYLKGLSSNSNKNKEPSSGSIEEQIKKYCDMLLETLHDNYIPDDSASQTPQTRNRSHSTLRDLIVWRGSTDIPKDSIQMGLTKVFLRKSAHDILEARRSRRIVTGARRIQCNYRGSVKRRFYLKCRWAAMTIQRMVRGVIARAQYELMRYERPTLRIQTWFRMHYAYHKFQMYRYAIVYLQSRYRRSKAIITTKELRYKKHIIDLQRYVRGLIQYKKYNRFQYALIQLQNHYRRRIARKELISLRLEAKDLGKLKQSNEALKAEIEELRAKAADENRKNEERISAAKDSEILRLQKELENMKNALEKENKLRQEAEKKLKEIEEKNDSLETQLAVHSLNLDTYKGGGADSIHNSHSPVKLNFTSSIFTRLSSPRSPRSPIHDTSSTVTTTAMPNEKQLITELRKERAEKESLQEEITRLRTVSTDLKNQVETLKTQITPPRRPDVDPRRLKSNKRASVVSIDGTATVIAHTASTDSTTRDTLTALTNMSNTSKNLALGASGGGGGGGANLTSSSGESLELTETLEAFDRNIQSLKFKLKQGIQVVAADADKGVQHNCVLKLDNAGDNIVFEPANRRYNIFSSKYDIPSIRLVDILEVKPGIDIPGANTAKFSYMTIISKGAHLDDDPRIIYCQLNNLDDRNTVLTGLRSLVSFIHLKIPAMKASLPISGTAATRDTIGGSGSGGGGGGRNSDSRRSTLSALGPDANIFGDDLDNYIDAADLKRQLMSERLTHEQMMLQVVKVTNDLNERDEQISELRKRENMLQNTLMHLEKSHEQDAVIRMQLGRRLEQVLIEKEEAMEQAEMLTEQVSLLRESLEKLNN